MLHQLSSDDFARARALFGGDNLHLAVVSALAGESPAELYVDDPRDPHAGLLLLWNERHFLAGEPHDGPFARAVAALLCDRYMPLVHDGESFDRFIVYDPAGWEAYLPALFAGIESFRAERGPMLTRFAAFEVLKQRFSTVWWEWPLIWRRPSDATLSRLRHTADEEMTYQEYIQWLADRQLLACQTAARDLNLPVGLYLDLAVGVEAAGADAWSAQDALTRGLSIGAPPDAFNPRGQNWGLVSFHPQALVDSNFLFFRQTLAATMRHAGAVRIDHALGLNRLYLIPNGQEAEQGAYVRFPFEAMLAVVSQESVRSRCLVIGEDLGTVPPGVSETLQVWGVWSYLVAMFERGADGGFREPERYAEHAIVTFGTHDLPTFAGWIKGHDLTLRNAIGLAAGENVRDRDAAYKDLLSALHRHGIQAGRDGPFIAVMCYLARSRSRLMSVTLEDVIGLEDQTNVPGTVAEHPNWRRRLPIDLKEFCALGGFEPIASAMAKEGRVIHP